VSGGRPFPISGSRRGERPVRGLIAEAVLTFALTTALLSAVPASRASELADKAAELMIADAEPHLPPAVPRVGTIRRGADGRIEIVDPKRSGASSASLCAANTLCVGEGQEYATLSAALAVAQERNVIEIAAGMYRESATVAVRDLTIRGADARPHFDCAGVVLQAHKACLLLAADGATLENLDISGAEISEEAGLNGACIRNEPNMSFTLRNVICHESQAGLIAQGGIILIENSEFYDNGWNEFAHNVSFGGECSVTVRGSVFRDSRVGHEFKSRCFSTVIADSIFRSTRGSRNIDIADGGGTSLYHSILVKTLGTDNKDLIGFASESCTHPGDMLIKDVRIINADPNAQIRNFDRCAGHAIFLEAVSFEGFPPKKVGYIKDEGAAISGLAPPSSGSAIVPLSHP